MIDLPCLLTYHPDLSPGNGPGHDKTHLLPALGFRGLLSSTLSFRTLCPEIPPLGFHATLAGGRLEAKGLGLRFKGSIEAWGKGSKQWLKLWLG